MQEMDADESFQSKSAMVESEPGTEAGAYEASSVPKYEMDSRKDAVELPLNQPMVEMDANHKREEERGKMVEHRVDAGYDGAYRGN